MYSMYALVFSGAFFTTLLAILALQRLAPRLGLIDAPEGRKTHTRVTPVVGGLAIMIGATSAIFFGIAFRSHAGEIIEVANTHRGLFAGAAMLLIVGAIDDWRPIAARYKLLVQLAACVCAVGLDGLAVGEVVLVPNGGAFTLGPLVAPFTILVMLTITNALNMIDGIDGLAGGIALVGFAIMAKALTAAGFPTAPYLIAAVGALSAFLLFNYPLLPNRPAAIFLGDSGSLLCGFALAYLALDISALPNRVFKPSTALWFFFIPVADTIWLYLRRTIVARAPFAAGRDHIHHLLMEHFSARTVAWILVGASALMAGGSYFAERSGAPSLYLILAWIVAFLAYGVLTQKAWRRAWEKGPVHQAVTARKTAAAE